MGKTATQAPCVSGTIRLRANEQGKAAGMKWYTRQDDDDDPLVLINEHTLIGRVRYVADDEPEKRWRAWLPQLGTFSSHRSQVEAMAAVERKWRDLGHLG